MEAKKREGFKQSIVVNSVQSYWDLNKIVKDAFAISWTYGLGHQPCEHSFRGRSQNSMNERLHGKWGNKESKIYYFSEEVCLTKGNPVAKNWPREEWEHVCMLRLRRSRQEILNIKQMD